MPSGSASTTQLTPPWPIDVSNYLRVWNDSGFATFFFNSLKISAAVTILVLLTAPLAGYAFAKMQFRGREPLFALFLAGLVVPAPSVIVALYGDLQVLGLIDTHIAVALAHCLFNVPLAVWILEGFMSGVPKEIDETAYIDGYSFPKFFVKIFIPLIGSGIGVTAFFCFMFSWVELLLARTLTSVDAKPIAAVMTRTVSASGIDWGVLAAAGVLTILPGMLVIWFVRNHVAKGFALGRV